MSQENATVCLHGASLRCKSYGRVSIKQLGRLTRVRNRMASPELTPSHVNEDPGQISPGAVKQTKTPTV